MIAYCGRLACVGKQALIAPSPAVFVPLLVQVCEKDGYHMSWAVKLVQQICKVFSTAPERFTFIQHLENMFSEVTREFYESSVAGGLKQLNIFPTKIYTGNVIYSYIYIVIYRNRR